MTASMIKGIHALVEQIDTPTASYLNSCVRCGFCAHACLFYTETGDPQYTPIFKLEPLRKVWKQHHTFWGKFAAKLGWLKPLTDEELTKWEPLVYDSCTLCGRCSLVCPVGNDITYMIRKLREGMVAAGHAPKGLKDATVRAVEIGSPMGVTLSTLQAQIKRAEQETGLKVPIDQNDADILVLLSSAEIAQFAEIIPALMRICDHAGVSWTISSQAFEATNSGIQIGSSDIAKEILLRIVKAAEKLKVKTVLSPECGHAYMALRWEGPNLIGRSYAFEVVHVLEWLDTLLQQGKLQLDGKIKERITFHDPCQMVRRGGVIDQPRHLLKAIAADFVEMKDHGIWNWCCGGGGGVSANERAEPLRLQVFSRKKKQLDAIGVTTMVTACSNCRNMLEDGLEANEMTIDVVGLTETVAQYLKDTSSHAGA